jgi:hypothetical protein
MSTDLETRARDLIEQMIADKYKDLKKKNNDRDDGEHIWTEKDGIHKRVMKYSILSQTDSNMTLKFSLYTNIRWKTNDTQDTDSGVNVAIYYIELNTEDNNAIITQCINVPILEWYPIIQILDNQSTWTPFSWAHAVESTIANPADGYTLNITSTLLTAFTPRQMRITSVAHGSCKFDLNINKITEMGLDINKLKERIATHLGMNPFGSRYDEHLQRITALLEKAELQT